MAVQVQVEDDHSILLDTASDKSCHVYTALRKLNSGTFKLTCQHRQLRLVRRRICSEAVIPRELEANTATAGGLEITGTVSKYRQSEFVKYYNGIA